MRGGASGGNGDDGVSLRRDDEFGRRERVRGRRPIEAEASKEEANETGAIDAASTINVPNVNAWQRAAVRLSGRDGLLGGSGNFVSLSDKDGTYHVERATKEMKKKMIRKPPR